MRLPISYSNPKRSLVAPLVLLSLLLLGLSTLGTLTLIRSFDSEARMREQDLVANGIAGSVAEISAAVVPQVVWGDAVRNLDHRFDPNWARPYILDYLINLNGFSEVFVVSGQDRLLIGQSEKRPSRTEDYERITRAAPDLIPEIRRNEAARDRQRKSGVLTFSKEPIQASALVSVDGTSYAVTASRVQPDHPSLALRGPNGPIVIAALKIDQNFVQRFSERFLLSDLRIIHGDAPAPRGMAQSPLRSSIGKTVARLVWRPQNPGATLFERMLPGLLLLGAILGLLAFKMIRRTHRMAQGLITSEARAAHLAYHDALTGLANRVQFSDQLSRALTRLRRGGMPLAVLCIDLDRFKDINDNFGHGVGDELLKEAARRMATECRTDDMLARLSGDEFAIVCTAASDRSATALAERICAAIARPFDSGGTQLNIACSIGITFARSGDVDPVEILRQADIALYRAKEDGRGRYNLFEPEMDAAMKGRRAIEADLRIALACSQLDMHYQPQVNRQGRIIGLEALVRWEHPKRGTIAPAFFVPIAEQSKLVLDLGLFTLRRAFTDSQRWPELRIAINISANQIRDPEFLDLLGGLIRETKIDPNRFDLEITEGILLGDDPETHERLARLSAMGFGLALDDFGTGYSSLSYLNRYPIGKIKIDRSFIANLGVTSEADAVVIAIIKLAHALNLGVVAEGVETAAQYQQLKAVGCTELQGFLFSEPISADAIDKLLQELAAAKTKRVLAA